MTVIIPQWLLWTLGLLIGAPALLILISFTIVGAIFAFAWRGPNW